MSSNAWQTVKWGDLATLEYGKSLKDYQVAKGDIPVYGTNGPIGFTDKPLCPFPSVIIGRKGAYRGVHYSNKPFFVIDTAFYLKPKTDEIDLLFAYYQLLTQDINSMDSGSAIPSTSREDFYNLEIMLPPISSQRRIAAILSAFDEKIELNRQINATLEAIAQAIFKEWFYDFNFPGATGEMVESESGMIPYGWRVVRLGEITDLTWGDTNTTKKSYVSEGFPAYSAAGADGYLSYFDFDRTGIVVSAIGAYAGKTWLALEKWSCIKNTIRFWSTDENISNEFLFIYTGTKDFWPLRGSAQPFISQADARDARVLYPGHGLSRTFGEYVGPLFQEIKRGDEESVYLGKIREALLPKLISGVIEV